MWRRRDSLDSEFDALEMLRQLVHKLLLDDGVDNGRHCVMLRSARSRVNPKASGVSLGRAGSICELLLQRQFHDGWRRVDGSRQIISGGQLQVSVFEQ